MPSEPTPQCSRPNVTGLESIGRSASSTLDWLARSLRFDFGESMRFRRPVAALIRERAANTAILGLSSLALATVIGLPLGVFTGSRQRHPLAILARVGSLVVLSMPSLVTSLVSAARGGAHRMVSCRRAAHRFLPTPGCWDR